MAQLAFYGTAPLFDDANASRKCMNLKAEMVVRVGIEPTTNGLREASSQLHSDLTEQALTLVQLCHDLLT
jgi:hypothetical protein